MKRQRTYSLGFTSLGLVFLVSLLALVAIAACEDTDELVSPFEVESVDIVPAVDTLEVGRAAVFEANVQFLGGPGRPSDVDWSVTDTSIVTLQTGPFDQAQVTGKRPGSVFVVGLIIVADQQFRDSSRAVVVPDTIPIAVR